MSSYIKIDTNEYPRYIGDIQLDHPEWSIEEPLPENWAEVEDTEFPGLGPYDIYGSVEAELIDGKWKQKWIIETLTPEAYAEMKKQDALNKIYSTFSLSEEALSLADFSPSKIKNIDNAIDDIVISLLGGNNV